MCFEMENIWSFCSFQQLKWGIFNVLKQLGHSVCILNSTSIEGDPLQTTENVPFESTSWHLAILMDSQYDPSFIKSYTVEP